MNLFENFNRMSFWLGFIAACLIWLLGLRLRKFWPDLRNYFSDQLAKMKTRQSTSVDATLRSSVLKRAQKTHLAAPLFALDEILITPHLMTPPKMIEPGNPGLIESARPQVLPDLPLVPQFSAQFNNPTLEIPRVLRFGVNFAILGYSGAGKTTALAYLASLFARKDPVLGSLSEHIPIYLHFNDIEHYLAKDQNPVQVLVKGFNWHVQATLRPQLQGFIAKQIQEGKAVLLLDGLDEIPSAQYQRALAFIAALVKANPQIRIVTTASLDRAYGLQDLGIELLPIAGWTREEVSRFILQWGEQWNHFIAQGLKKASQPDEIDALLIRGWATNSIEFFTPLEWTTRLWGAYTGNLPGTRGVDAIEAYCSSISDLGINRTSLSLLASHMLDHQINQIPYIEVENILSKVEPPVSIPASEISFEPGNLVQNENTFQSTTENQKKVSPETLAGRAIDALVEYGLLRENPEEHLSFISPVIQGYLASRSNTILDPETAAFSNDPWSVQSEFIHYSILHNQSEWLKAYLIKDQEPFYFHTVQAGLWMRDLPPKDPNRTLVMRYIAQRGQLPETPYKTSLAFFATASMSNDPAVIQFNRQLYESGANKIRQIAILCLGLLRDMKSFNLIVSVLNDPDLHMRWAGCFALAALETPDGQNGVRTILTRSDEPLRLATAEAIAAYPSWGHEILKSAETSEDILTRRAMIFGLLHIQDPWVIDILERMSMEDSQWVIRNFAGQGLEYLQTERRRNPLQRISLTDTPWLINFAARQGQGVSRGESPVPLLLQVLNSGSDEEKVAAVQLLGKFPEKSAVEGLRSTLNAETPGLQFAAFDALWKITLTHPDVVRAKTLQPEIASTMVTRS